MQEKARKISKISLVEQVLTSLREDFLSETYAANTSLPSEQELAERFGVSRLTMRSALQRADSEGWIKISHGRASKVLDYKDNIGLDLLPKLLMVSPDNIISYEDFLYYHRFIQWLHGRTHITACRKAKPHDKPILMGIVAEFSKDLSVREIWELDFRFYRELTRMSESIVLMMLQNMHRNTYRALLDSGAIITASYSQSFYAKTVHDLTEAICANDETALRKLHPGLVEESNKSCDILYKNFLER